MYLLRRRASALALWRLRAPLFGCDMDAAWGVDLAVVESLFDLAAAAPGGRSEARYGEAVAALRRAPLFDSEVDPEVRELVQLEALSRLLVFGEELADPEPGPSTASDADRFGHVMDGPREMAGYLDDLVEDSFRPHPAEEARRRYLTSLPEPVRGRGLGYLASRGLVVELACEEGLRELPPGAALPDTATGRELIGLCEAFGAELVETLRWLGTAGK